MSDTSTPRLNDTPRINVTEATDNTNAGSTTSEPFWKHITRTSPVVPEDIPEEDVIHLQDSRPRSSSSKANRSPKMSGSAKQGRRDKKSTNLSVPFPGGKENTQKEITEEMRISTPIQRESTNVSLDTESWMSVDARIHPTMVQIAADENPQTVLSPGQTWIGAAIPYLPLGLAILCLIMNIFIPGSGTILSGFSILCCGRSRVTNKKDDHIITTICVNVWVGAAQLFTVTFLLVGWFWSFAWGIKMVLISVDVRREVREKREKELQVLALSAFGPTVSMNAFK